MPNFKQNLVLLKIHSKLLPKGKPTALLCFMCKHCIFKILKALKVQLQASKNT